MSRIYDTPLLDAILDALRIDGPQSTPELAERIGKLRSCVRNCITMNRKLFRVHAWNRSLVTRGRPSPVWALAIKHAADAPPPEPLSRKEINRMWRRRHAALLRARYRAKKRRAGPWDALLPKGVRV